MRISDGLEGRNNIAVMHGPVSHIFMPVVVSPVVCGLLGAMFGYGACSGDDCMWLATLLLGAIFGVVVGLLVGFVISTRRFLSHRRSKAASAAQ